ncbi:AAEL007419-PA [Aedes aegypti]|uniref:AAEL007419-PA n=1 Tax=Aedes aegypti TaxID=7159 RepID=Q0IEZ0_AEDAE|nr:AAEL007419-PA [Aedes aegypti]
MWLNGLCCGGLCGVGEVLKGGGQQHPFDDRQDQEELNPSSDCGTGNESKATLKARPHVVMGCTPSILSSNNQQQQQQHQRKDSSSLYGGNLSNAGSGTLADNNGAGSNKFANNAALNQAQMLGYGQGGKEGIAGAGTGAGEKEYPKKDSILSISGLGHVSVVSNVLRRPTIGSKYYFCRSKNCDKKYVF